MKTKWRVSVIGPFPPPVHGAAEITRHIVELLERSMEVERLTIAPNANLKGLSYHLSRIARVMTAVSAIVAGRGPVYISAAGGIGLSYNIVLAAFARLVARPILIHHHSFAYLDHFNWLAAILVWISGANAEHICLCDRMKGLLIDRYGLLRTSVVSNAAFYNPIDNLAMVDDGRPLRIGHLGNLSIEKGLDLVISLTEALERRNIPVHLMLAGPTADNRASTLLCEARHKMGSKLTEHGTVYGIEKEAFLNSIDLFVFPTRYANEAEPLVVFEALSHGVPVIAFGRGCITEQIADAGLVIEPGGDFLYHATSVVAEWSMDREIHATYRARALKQFSKLHDHAAKQIADLLENLRSLAA